MTEKTYFLVSLPTSIAASGNKDDALTALRATVTTDLATTVPFAIPGFKVGTLDALVRQADDLAKLEQSCRSVVGKVADSLRGLLEGDADKLAEQKVVNDRPVDAYLSSFQWNRVKYRADQPISALIDTLDREVASVDNDVKAKFSQYNASRTTLATSQRAQTGNLSVRSLASVVNPERLLAADASEYLQQVLLAVPNAGVKEFLRSYEGLVEHWVVPRSSEELARDDEFTLFAVTVFRKQAAEFVHKARERRWTPREWKVKEGGREAERVEADRLEKEERRVWGEALRLGRTGYSDAVMAWVHVLVLRVFVETVLRYGLPLDFFCGLVKTTPKQAGRAKQKLDDGFSYLAGNAFGRDKKGRVTKDDSSTLNDMQSAGHGHEDYSAYVFYRFEVL